MKWWKGYPWRMIQTNLREIDFRDLDVDRFVEDLRSFHATVLLVNAGGISASYPTELPWQYQNPWARNDTLHRLVNRCHEEGIRVLARTDFSKVRQELFEGHPEWAFRTAEGKVMNYNGFVQTCPSSVYQQEYAFETLREIFTKIPFDGLYCNMGGFQTRDYSFRDYGFCHCDNCRRLFREQYGYEDLPTGEDHSDPVYTAYSLFQKRSVREYRQKMVAFLKTFPRDLCFDDEDYARIEASTELHRRLPHWQYHASSNCRAILGDGSSGIICSNTSVDYMGYALRENAVSSELQKLRLWQNLTNLGALDYYLMGRIDNHLDRTAFLGVREVFAFHTAHENVYRGMRNQGRVLLRREDRWVATEEEKGWIRTLTEAHIPFAEVLPTEYLSADLSRYDIVLLPDSHYLSPEEAEKTDRFAESGGTVIVVGSTGLSDAHQGRRETPVFRSQGIRWVLEERSDMASAMFLLEQDAAFFPSLCDADVLALGDRYLFMEAEQTPRKLLKMIPVHPFGPPECCYFTEVSEEAGLYVNPWGKGRTVTIPWYPGEFYARTGFNSLRDFMKDVLCTLCGARPLSNTLSPMVEVSLAENNAGDMLVQLVNNSGCFGVSYVKPLPVEQIGLQIPYQGKPEKVCSLRGTSVTWELRENVLYLTLQRLEEYDGILIHRQKEIMSCGC